MHTPRLREVPALRHMCTAHFVAAEQHLPAIRLESVARGVCPTLAPLYLEMSARTQHLLALKGGKPLAPRSCTAHLENGIGLLHCAFLLACTLPVIRCLVSLLCFVHLPMLDQVLDAVQGLQEMSRKGCI